jgi:hypothetical protein
MGWRTYLVIYFGTKKVKPSEVAKMVEGLGFKTKFGSVDFTYSWENKPTKEQVLELADKVNEKLKDSGVIFNLDTQKQLSYKF